MILIILFFNLAFATDCVYFNHEGRVKSLCGREGEKMPTFRIPDGATNLIVMDNSLVPDRKYRSAWRIVGGKVVVDLLEKQKIDAELKRKADQEKQARLDATNLKKFLSDPSNADGKEVHRLIRILMKKNPELFKE